MLSAAPDASAISGRAALRVVTYNIHGCLGLDLRYDPGRIAAVLREIDADIVCLQEVDARRTRDSRGDQAAFLANATESKIIMGAAATGRGRFANAILTRFPPLATRAIDLEVPGYEPRSALDVDLMIDGLILRVMATHFGLHAGERRLQANRLIAALDNPGMRGTAAAHAVLLVGDLNEWRGRAGGVRALDRCLGPSATPRTFPSWMPVLPLDRIYALGHLVLRDLQVYRSPLARVASDHLPLVGTLSWNTDSAGLRGHQAGSPDSAEMRHAAPRRVPHRSSDRARFDRPEHSPRFASTRGAGLIIIYGAKTQPPRAKHAAVENLDVAATTGAAFGLFEARRRAGDRRPDPSASTPWRSFPYWRSGRGVARRDWLTQPICLGGAGAKGLGSLDAANGCCYCARPRLRDRLAPRDPA